jgi:hypothetical protein
MQLTLPRPVLLAIGLTGIPIGQAFVKLAHEAGFIFRNGGVADWLRFLPYETARHAGFLLGLRAESLPVSVRRACSSLRYFWVPAARSEARK